MIIFPQAKINLGLRILRKRDDGYHDIDTCMLPIPLKDILEIIPDREEELQLSGIPVEGDTASNLCWKAYRLLQSEYSLPQTYFHLMKLIPMGAGLGGGSSDAAEVIKGLNQVYNLGISDLQMEEYAARLGSDCPFFIKNVPQIAQGRGEMLSSIDFDLKGYFVKIVNPGIHVGTAEAYAGTLPNEKVDSVRDVLLKGVERWKDELVNDFELSVFAIHPILKAIKEELYHEGAVYAAMSGSGSTIFGIYRNEPIQSFPEYFEKIMRI
ncbi:MAG: 4-(cytidine 5'-diphospho)-2-C-methyl-D-erythritol kinase [Bacteroidetes bacterium]|nr:MAG: 4-(cytidine 5'-diphospho)-2-C-methyl-D-erythritol kinase [Bacteroidota bacterium]